MGYSLVFGNGRMHFFSAIQGAFGTGESLVSSRCDIISLQMQPAMDAAPESGHSLGQFLILDQHFHCVLSLNGTTNCSECAKTTLSLSVVAKKLEQLNEGKYKMTNSCCDEWN